MGFAKGLTGVAAVGALAACASFGSDTLTLRGDYSAIGHCLVNRLPSYGYKEANIDYREFAPYQHAVLYAFETQGDNRRQVYAINLQQQPGGLVEAVIDLAHGIGALYQSDAEEVLRQCAG